MRLVALALALLTVSCVSPAGVTLDAYQGALLTHFGGIPEGNRICGWLTNRGSEPVAWVRIRLVSSSGTPGERERFTSSWIYAEPLAPGESAAFELPDPPLADAIDLRVTHSGRDLARARSGRKASRADDCSEPWLHALLAADSEARPTADLGLIPLDRPGASAPADLLAEQP